MEQLEKQESPEALDRRIRRWRVWLTGFGAFLLGMYFVYFGWALGQNPATDADKWGQFGDFFGGILNPLVAFAAFYWLTQSVKLQKTELAETRIALQEAAKAQQEQVANGNRNIQIAALTAVVNAAQAQIYAIEKDIILIKENQVKASNETIESIQRINNLIKSGNVKYQRGDLEKYLNESRLKKSIHKNQLMEKEKKLNQLVEECSECHEKLRSILNIE